MNFLKVSQPNLFLKNFGPTFIRPINRSLTTTDDKKIIISKYKSEEIPPIPPYKGFQGSDFTKAKENIQKIRAKFKYG